METAQVHRHTVSAGPPRRAGIPGLVDPFHDRTPMHLAAEVDVSRLGQETESYAALPFHQRLLDWMKTQSPNKIRGVGVGRVRDMPVRLWPAAPRRRAHRCNAASSLRSGEQRDGHASVPELRIQLCSHVPGLPAGSGCHSRYLWPLPFHSVVHAIQLISVRK
jgi:hypothetical protein